MTELQQLRDELDRFAATGVQRQRFESDPPKAIAAISKAVDRGAKSPLTYALTIFNSTDSPAKKGEFVNRTVIVECEYCDGDRFVPWDSESPKVPYGETYAACPYCNATCNTIRVGWASPSPDRVRERLSRRAA